MKQHEITYQHGEFRLERDGQTAIIKVGDGSMVFDLDELETLIDALDYLEQRVRSYTESESIKKVVNE